MSERVGGVEIMNAAIHVFVGAFGFFYFQTIEGFGMDDAFNVFFAVNDGKIGKTRFVESVKDERAENFGILDEDDTSLRRHEVKDLTIIETHNGGEASAIGVV